MDGIPEVLRFDDWGTPSGDGAPTAPFLQQAAALTIAVGPAPTDLPFDLRTDDPAVADRWAEAFARSPHAALAAALLVREAPASTWAGLVAESSTYSMLQAGPGFLSWREHSDARPADDHGDARVRVDAVEGVTEVVLTRPGRHNALDVRMRDQLYDALLAVEVGDGPIVIRGEGPSFCTGGDLGEFGTFPDPATAHAVRLQRSLALRFANLSPRMVVGVHGLCLGSGIELPAFASHVVAADDTEIGLPEAELGLIPGAGGTVSIPRRCGSQRMLELLLTGERIDAATALAWGLVDEVVPRVQLEERVRDVARSPVSSRSRAR